MGLFKKFMRLIGADGDSPIAEDEHGHALYADDVAAKILSDLERRRSDRLGYELQWQLNSNFLAGNQNVDINPSRGDIELCPQKYDYEERAVYNRIAPLYETRIAHLQTVNYLMRVKPRTDELDDYSKAEISSKLLQYWQNVLGFREIKNKILAWSEITGTCFALSGWDAVGGREVARLEIEVEDEEGECRKKDVPMYEGALTCDILSPYEVYPENINSQEVEDQHSIILEQIMSTSQIYDQYGIEVEGVNELNTYSLMPVVGSFTDGYLNTTMGVSSMTVRDSEKVVTYLEVPNREHPDGVFAIIIGQKLVHYGSLPYKTIPLVAIKSKAVAGKFFGKSVIEDLIPLQREYNIIKNKIHDFLSFVTSGVLFVEEGSVDIDEVMENGAAPGSPIVYRKGYNAPRERQFNSLPPQVFQEYEQVARDMEYVAGVSQLMVSGAAASGVTSGVAINSIRDIDETRMSLTAEGIRNSVLKMAKQWLEICKTFQKGYSTLDIVGDNGFGDAVVWCSEDINSFDIVYTTENELITSPEQQAQNFVNAFNMGLFTDETGQIPRRIKKKMLEVQKLGTYSELTSEDEMQATRARRENTLFERGVMPEIAEYDDHEIHVDEHMRYILQRDFEMMRRDSPERAQAFLDHVNMHRQIIVQSEQAAMQAAGENNGAEQ